MKESYRKIFLSLVHVVAIVLALLGASRLFGPIPVSITQTTTEKTNTFDVTGESEITTVPDQAEVNVGIAIRQSTVAQAQEAANTVINNISQELKALGIDEKDIKTADYSINPDYNYESQTRNIIGYNVTTNLRITVKDLPQVNQVIDTATRLGANQVNGIRFTLSQTKEEMLTKQARKEAIADAQANAKELANLAGMKLGKIINVYEQPPYDQPIPYGGEMLRTFDTAATPTALEPGSTTHTYRVTLSYETL